VNQPAVVQIGVGVLGLSSNALEYFEPAIYSSAVLFTGIANDPEDGDLSDSLVWSSSIDGLFKTGSSKFYFDGLSVGRHIISASVIDSQGQESVSLKPIRVMVVPLDAAVHPSVNITEPSQGSNVQVGNPVSFAGVATDPVEGDISGNIEWTSATTGRLGFGSSLTVNTLPLGVHEIIAKVTTYQGDSTFIRADSVTIEVVEMVNEAPVVSIILPENGLVVSSGQAIVFEANATDQEDGDLTAQLEWQSDVDGGLGVGTPISVDTLTLGDHVIIASVRDAQNQLGQATITVRVKAQGDTIILVPIIDLLLQDEQAASGEVQQ